MQHGGGCRWEILQILRLRFDANKNRPRRTSQDSASVHIAVDKWELRQSFAEIVGRACRLLLFILLQFLTRRLYRTTNGRVRSKRYLMYQGRPLLRKNKE